MTNFSRWLAAFVAVASLSATAGPLYAQGFPGMGGGMGGPQPQQPSKPKVDPNAPVTHAASGASDDAMRLGGSEPTLPVNPLEIPPAIKKQIGSDADPEREQGLGPKTFRTVIPPYYSEKSGTYSFKTVFPVWVERKMPNDRASLFGLVYYNRRSTKYDADIVFPFFWNVRDDKSLTTVVGPVIHREAPG
ncbi:MAG TPA: hypothetical protein VJT73_05645, partial [Polyangiaceae bacterium]|nr:hypothetical protein [Polyangiaceae bacterium]